MLEALVVEISKDLNENVISYSSVSGGDINHALKLETSDNIYFCKYNTSIQHSGIILSELEGLKALSYNDVRIPQIKAHIEMPALSAIVLEWISSIPISSSNLGQISLSEQLVSLHRSTKNQYGASKDNYIGSLHQTNKWYDNFIEYYFESRLLPQFKIAFDNEYIQDRKVIDSLSKRIANIIPIEKPTLIHGDLWSGNYMISKNNMAYLIDPSVSYGHREMDIAMLHLFGQVPDEVMRIYNNEIPLSKGWIDRMDIFQLYYLLVHLNIFGKSYLSQVQSIIERYD